MPNIDALFEDFFDDPRRADGDLDAGTLDHIQRLEAQNADGSFDGMIAKTRAAHTTFTTARSTTSGTLAQQKGATDVVELLEADLRKFLRDGQDQINVTFKGPSPDAVKARIRFYPRGLDPFNEADRGDWAVLLTTYGAAVDDNETKLPPDFVTDYRTKSKALLDAIGEQGGLKSKVGTGRKDVERYTKPLTMQLSENARNLGIRFAAEPSKGASFFDARYFERPRNEPASIAPGRQRLLSDDPLGADDGTGSVTLTNAGPEPLLFARVAQKGDEKTPLDAAHVLSVPGGETRTLKAMEIPGTGTLLVVRNPSPREGKFRVEVG